MKCTHLFEIVYVLRSGLGSPGLDSCLLYVRACVGLLKHFKHLMRQASYACLFDVATITE